ncbi:MAG: hypothetical protein ACO3SE_09060, partial [Sedimenticolaceae bacterium]
NQVTRAVIINKIIEAVKIVKNKNKKEKEESKKVNQMIGNVLTNVAPKPNNGKKPGAVNASTGTENFPRGPEKTASGGPKNSPTSPAVAANLINQIANLQARLNNAQENAAVAAAEQKAEANAKVAELTKSLNETTKALENVMSQLTKERNEAKKKFEELQNKLQSALNNTEKANLANKLAKAKTTLNEKNAEIATLKTSFNSQANMIINLQAQLEQAKQNAAEGKANANGKVAELTKKLESAMANLEKQKSKAEAKVASIQTEIENAKNNTEMANLKKQLANAQNNLNLKNKVIAVTRARAAVSKRKLTANKEAALAEVNQYKKDFAIATKTLENLTKKGVANKQQISTLERSIRILETRLKSLGNRRVAETTGLRKSIEKLRSELQKLTTAPAPVQNTGNAPSALNLFKTKVTEAKKTIMNARLNQLLVNANKPNPNLANLERQFADIAGKPRIYLFLNQFDGTNFPNYAKPTGIQTFGAKSDNVTNAVTNIKSIVNDYTSIEPKKNLNLFFIGPSGSGKTFLFNKYLGKNISGMVTAYYPTFDYNLQSGILTISDTSEPMTYNEFKRRFIRPTPFNPNSSRAHMSYENGDVTAFDLAGTENPMAIMDKALGYNIFEKQYWEKFSSASVSDIAQRRQTQTEVKQLLAALELPSNGVGLSGLDQMVFLYVFWNYIDRKVGPIERVIRRFRQKKINPSRLQLLVEIFNDIKRVFEGFWITRSLHALNLLFTNNSYKNLVNKTNTTVTGSNIARSNVTGFKGAFEIELKRRVVNKRGIPKYETSKFVKQLANIPLSQSAKFIILNKTNPSYETNFVADLKQSGNRNCLIGVVNAQSKFPEQRQAAINYLESLQK